MTEIADQAQPSAAAPLDVGVKLARGWGASEILVRRWMGCWVDFAVLGLILLPPFLLPPSLIWMVWIAVAAVLIYFPVTEGLWGRSVGKLVTGTIVVNRKGSVPGVPKAIIRTILRLVEVNPFLIGEIPAAIVVASTKSRQRLGDLAAGTYVVDFKELRRANAGSAAAAFD